MDEDIFALLGLDDLTGDKLPSPELFRYYNFLKSRTLFINDEITDATLEEIVQWILYWNREDSILPDDLRKPIKIFINSIGGSIDVQAILCNVIEMSKTPIYSYGMGMVASAASLIFMACHKRYMMPNAYMLVHKGSAALQGSFDDVASAMADYEKTVEKMLDFITKHSNYSADEIKENIRKDWYIKSKEAVEHGMADEIVTNIDVLL